MKRAIDSLNLDTNPSPLKKRKINPLEQWDQVRSYFDKFTNLREDHVIWTGELYFNGNLPNVSFNFGTTSCVSHWFKALQDFSLKKSNVILEKTCQEKLCLSHSYYRDISIKSIRELDAETYFLLCDHIDKTSEEIDSPITDVLKTKCRIWTGATGKNGYGRWSVFGKTISVTRMVLKLKLCDDIREDIVCRHKCRNILCVNEDHLEAGSTADNVKDKFRDKSIARGIKFSSTIITKELATDIFWSRQDKSKTQKQRGEKFGVSKSLVASIDRGKNWAYLFTDDDRKKVKEGEKIKKIKRKITEDEILEVQKCQKEGLSISKCMKKLNMSEKHVTFVYKGKSYIKTTTLQNMTSEEKEKRLKKLKQNCIIFIDDLKLEHWLWKGKLTSSGYGRTNLKGKSEFTHRISFMMVNGTDSLTNDLQVRHKCKFKNCVNAEHLEIGTASENSMDKVRDGTLLYGENHPLSKISKEIAKNIQNSKGQGTIFERGKLFGVSSSLVSSIDNNYSWCRSNNDLN